MGPTGVGQGLGVARGEIVIGTSSLERAESISRVMGANVARSFGQVDTSINRTVGGIGRLNQSLGGLGGLLGGFAATRVAQFVLQADELATSYKRQSVAALNLAGSQEKLNELLSAYDKATGGAIDKASRMAEVAKLQALGFADSAEELNRFVSAARGISIATGRPQDYVISQLQLEIANQSMRRLDQIGLNIPEVKKKIAELKAADRSLSDEMAYQNAIIDVAIRKYGGLLKSTEALPTGAEKVQKAFKDLQLTIGEDFGDEISAVLTGAADQLEGIARNVHDMKRDFDEIRRGVQRDLGGSGTKNTTRPQNPLVDWLTGGDPLGDWMRTHRLGTKEGEGLWLYGSSNYNYDRYSTRAGGVYPGGPGWMPPTVGGMTEDPHLEERRQEQLDFAHELRDIESQANEQRLDATRQYESQRSQVIESYGRTIAREEEDFARQRARAVEDFTRQVDALEREAAERDAKWASDLAERIADIQGDGNKRISEIEEDYQRDREKREQDHRDRLFDAAGRLDAVAVQQEQRNYRRQSQEAEERHGEQIDQVRQDMADRIAEEQRGAAERLAEAHKADAQRLEDMQRSFAEQQARENEDRATRLQRMAEDHAAQLAQLDAAQAERIAQINRHAEEERQAATDAHLKAMEKLGGTISEGWLLVQKSIEAAMLKEVEDFEKKLKAKYEGSTRFDRLGNPQTPYMPEFASGGWVGRTGPALVHAGEYVLSPQIAALAAAMQGGNSMNVGGINIYAPGGDAEAIANAVDNRLRQIYTAMRN